MQRPNFFVKSIMLGKLGKKDKKNMTSGKIEELNYNISVYTVGRPEGG